MKWYRGDEKLGRSKRLDTRCGGQEPKYLPSGKKARNEILEKRIHYFFLPHRHIEKKTYVVVFFEVV